MSETADRWMDRKDWPAGPWDDEPDRVEWRHLGLPCLIVRGGGGALCGYVGLPPGHPLYGMGDGDEPVWSLHVHGGITYGAPCAEDGHICHVPQPGEPDAVWWLGFDCSHCGDLRPRDVARYGDRSAFSLGRHEVYRDLAYVRGQVDSLAEQLLAVGVAKGGAA